MLKNQDILTGTKLANTTWIEQFCWIYEPSIVLLYIEIYCYLI